MHKAPVISRTVRCNQPSPHAFYFRGKVSVSLKVISYTRMLKNVIQMSMICWYTQIKIFDIYIYICVCVCVCVCVLYEYEDQVFERIILTQVYSHLIPGCKAIWPNYERKREKTYIHHFPEIPNAHRITLRPHHYQKF